MTLGIKILLIAFFLRIIPFSYVAVNNPQGFLLFDSYGYLNIADNLLDHQIFSRANKIEKLTPDISRTPIFPIFLSVLKTIYDSNLFIAFVILLVGCFNALLTYKLCLLIFNNHKIAFISAMLLAIDIPSIYFSSIILTETIFTFLLLCVTIYFVRYLTYKRTKLILITGVLSSILILCRPIAIFIPLILLIILIIKKTPIKYSVLFISSAYILVFGWMGRNYNTFNTFSLSSISSINFYFYTNASIVAEVNNITTNEAQGALKKELERAFDWQEKATDIVLMIDYCNTQSIKSIVNHPLIFTKQTSKGLLFFFIKPIRNYLDTFIGINKEKYSSVLQKKQSNPILQKLLNDTSKLTLILIFLQLIFTLLIGIGVVITLLKVDLNIQLITILALIFYFAITSSITEVDGRFRVPVLPLLAILTSTGIYRIMNTSRRQ
jgi:4-amino-4-deoxy-L-arabinose transferase-like glycosyltransferase